VLYAKRKLSFTAKGQMIEDRLLIWKFKGGSTDALRQIYLRYKDCLLKQAVVLAGDVSVAEEVVQDVFVHLARSADTVRVSGNLKAFLSTCVVNRIRNHARDTKRRRIVGDETLDTAISQSQRPEQWAIMTEELEILSRAMNQLDPDQREVILLYLEGGVRFKEIARIQNASINTVQGRYRYGLNKLRAILNGEVKK
jgi:RNA polymerase sigma factor (sigma-70 family)